MSSPRKRDPCAAAHLWHTAHGSRLSLRCASLGRDDIGLIFLSSHNFNLPSHNTFPLRGPLPRFASSFCPPRKGWAERRDGAFNDRACEARLTTLTRRVSHRFQTGAPASRRSTWRFRLWVPHFRGPPLLLRDRALSPATATGQGPRGCSPPGRKLPGSAPRASSCRDFSPWLRRTPSSLRLQDSPLERAPSNEQGRCGV